MNATDWFVIAAGAASIAWVNWYFFIAQRSTVTTFAQDDATRTAVSDTTAEVTRAAP